MVCGTGVIGLGVNPTPSVVVVQDKDQQEEQLHPLIQQVMKDAAQRYELTIPLSDSFNPLAPSARSQRRKQQRKGKKKYGW